MWRPGEPLTEIQSPHCGHTWRHQKWQRPCKFTSDVLMQLMGPEVFSALPELKRAHEPRPPNSAKDHLLIRSWSGFLGSSKKDLRCTGPGSWAEIPRCHRQSQDVSAALAEKRAVFNGIKRALYQKNVKFHLFYPARLQVMFDNNVLAFDSPNEVQKFYHQKFDHVNTGLQVWAFHVINLKLNTTIWLNHRHVWGLVSLHMCGSFSRGSAEHFVTWSGKSLNEPVKWTRIFN